MRPGKGMRASCGGSIRKPAESWSRSKCPPVWASQASNPTAATGSSVAAEAAARCASSGGPARRLNPDPLPGPGAPAKEERTPEEHDVDHDCRPAARRAVTQLRQKMEPTLAGRESQDVRERHE